MKNSPRNDFPSPEMKNSPGNRFYRNCHSDLKSWPPGQVIRETQIWPPVTSPGKSESGRFLVPLGVRSEGQTGVPKLRSGTPKVVGIVGNGISQKSGFQVQKWFSGPEMKNSSKMIFRPQKLFSVQKVKNGPEIYFIKIIIQMTNLTPATLKFCSPKSDP